MAAAARKIQNQKLDEMALPKYYYLDYLFKDKRNVCLIHIKVWI